MPYQSNPRTVVVMGATGAVGGEVISSLLARPNPPDITTLGRRVLPGFPTLRQEVVDVFDAASYASHLTGHDAAICTFGVGQPSKVSRDEFLRVDHDAVMAFAGACRGAGVGHFQLLGSVGAASGSPSFYLKSKGRLREGIAALGFERFSVFQPSMILTPTNRYGISQALTLALWPTLTPVLLGGLKKYRGIPVATLGAAIAHNLYAPGQGLEVLEWQEITELA